MVQQTTVHTIAYSVIKRNSNKMNTRNNLGEAIQNYAALELITDVTNYRYSISYYLFRKQACEQGEGQR